MIGVYSKIATVVALLGILWIALPLRLSTSGTQQSGEDCLTLSDSSPSARRIDVTTLERCAALYPNDVQLTADLGAAYESSNQSGRAEDRYRRALVIDPDYADLRLRLARLLLRDGKLDEAKMQASAALAIQPNHEAVIDVLQAIAAKQSGAEAHVH